MGVVSDLLKDVYIPRMLYVRQEFDKACLDKNCISQEVKARLDAKGMGTAIKKGADIAITAGSRGISNYKEILKAIVDYVKEKGGNPFLVPTMGSHGGATAEGQLMILESAGITEEYMDCPIKSSMETVQISITPTGVPVFSDKNAQEADGIIVVNRVKPHTCFRGKYESGIMKMMTIGLGKQKGAEFCHHRGFGHMAEMLEMIGHEVRVHSKILFAMAILENAYDETCDLVPLWSDEIESIEPQLLIRARELMPKILIDRADVLIVDEIGKNYSGDGIDPNITGAFCSPHASGGLKTQHVAVLDVSEASHGSTIGMGVASTGTKRLYDKFDPEKTYPNSLTATTPESSKVPMIFRNDKEAIQAAIKMSNDVDEKTLTVIRIPNSLHIDRIMISESLMEVAKRTPGMVIESEPEYMSFDENGNLF